MNLLKFWKNQHIDLKKTFADRCKTSASHINNVAYGYKPCGIPLAVAIEKETQGVVTRQELRPHDYWLIWPDLPAPKEDSHV